ncbi:MAG: DeoR/GlpR family DNA-binding transcription regulator [Clostridia bacterium]|nr:DeoR/GlpR family DNA-binding transcription regulator [Clostridia bacterium]
MLSDARQEMIKKIAFRDGEVIISKVASELGVSFETVRRDINALCSQNILSKVHGGAVPIRINEHEGHYLKRKSTNMHIKNALGAYTANLIRNSGVLFFSVGTTIEAVASSCSQINARTVITNSVSIAEIFGSSPATVILTGGHLNADERFCFGSETQNQIARYRADTAIISAVGIDENGIMCSSDEEGEIIAGMMKAADRVILVVESNKFSQKSVYRFSTLKHIDEIVTDNTHSIPQCVLKEINNHKIKLHTIEI